MFGYRIELYSCNLTLIRNVSVGFESTSYKVQFLWPLTTYKFRIAAVNVVGQGSFTPMIAQTTKSLQQYVKHRCFCILCTCSCVHVCVHLSRKFHAHASNLLVGAFTSELTMHGLLYVDVHMFIWLVTLIWTADKSIQQTYIKKVERVLEK